MRDLTQQRALESVSLSEGGVLSLTAIVASLLVREVPPPACS